MKKIVQECSQIPPSSSTDEVKLRLRGKGSGFNEGPQKQESDEPLHLCISSRYYEKYKTACELIRELILNVYEEYEDYCYKCNIHPITTLKIKSEESLSRRKGKEDYDEF